ncbi:MAG: hypothetical protein O3A36_00505 [bacterium]|nr:hypothetical protein [bacterium]
MKFLVSVLLLIASFLILFWWKHAFALPIFCSTRGCVTTIDRNAEKKHQKAFATVTQSSPPTETTILTTLVRRHLILHLPNTQDFSQEAISYRTDILHFTDEAAIKEMGFDSFTEYDNAVTIPFLLQQSYMNEHGFKDPQEAYKNLSKNYHVLSLLFGYTWDSSKGEVVPRI